MVQPRDSRGSNIAGNFHQKLRFSEWLVTEKGGERLKEMYREHSLGAQQWVKPVVLAAVILSSFKKEREGPELTH